MLWRELALRPQKFTAINQFGAGTCFVPAFILLACVGLFFIRLNTSVICAFSAGLSFFAAILSLFPVNYLGYYLPPPNAVSRSCRSACDVGSRKSRFTKTKNRFCWQS